MHNYLNKPGSFFLIAGPCVVENQAICMEIASRLTEITSKLEIPFIFKASYRKANRTSLDSFTGIGDEEAIEILARVKEKFGVPVTTDVHSAQEISMIRDIVDIIQIPAFLCRQSDLLSNAADTGKIINVKKGQFLSGEAMQFVFEKVKRPEQDLVLLTERGNSFGYQDLIVDMRNIPIMQRTGAKVVMDCTHSLQRPNQSSGVTGGDPEMISTIAKASLAAGADGLFMETHPRPKEALSDGANMLQLDKMEPLLKDLVRLHNAL